MIDPYPAAPSNLRSLRDRLMHVSRRDGLVFGRLQQHVGVLVVAQIMHKLIGEDGQPRLLLKGGSALELRRGIAHSRTSRDLDVVTRHDMERVWLSLAESSKQGWEGFTAVITEPEVITVPGALIQPLRFTAKLKYRGAAFVSIPVEISSEEAGNTDSADWVHSGALELLGLPSSQPIPCMTIPWQIAQKLHAVTVELADGRPNDRARDLVDLQILAALIADQPLDEVRRACVEVFGAREQQPWPPTVNVLDHWPRIYTTALSSVVHLGLAADVYDATILVNEFIQRVHMTGHPHTPSV